MDHFMIPTLVVWLALSIFWMRRAYKEKRKWIYIFFAGLIKSIVTVILFCAVVVLSVFKGGWKTITFFIDEVSNLFWLVDSAWRGDFLDT